MVATLIATGTCRLSENKYKPTPSEGCYPSLRMVGTSPKYETEQDAGL